MERSDEENDGVLYYDSMEFLPSDDEFGVWMNEPRSVNERRRDFYANMVCTLDSCDVASSSVEEIKFVPRESHGSEAADSSFADDNSKVREVVLNAESAFEQGRLRGGTKAPGGWWWNNIVKRIANRREKNEDKKKATKKRNAANAEQEFQAHDGAVLTMKFSPDGRYVASGGEDGVVRIWKIDDSSKGVFHIEESPLHELRGHGSEVLDLSWSPSNQLLSSSADGTVRLWKVGISQCLEVFRHNNYVTCVQFNPMDENMFVTGSVDGIVRVWGVREKRVVDWAVPKDVITALSYRPDGEGIIVGGIHGCCRFYQCQAGGGLQVEAELRICGKRINGVQFLRGDTKRIVISCDDSKLRVFDGVELVQTIKGLSKSFTCSDRHVISVGDDSRVHLWNPTDFFAPATRRTKSVRACKCFSSPRVSVAIPWYTNDERTASDVSTVKTKPPFYLPNCLFPKGSLATWPEESLPADTWAPLHVIVTASWDGIMRTYHNSGMP